MENQKLESDSEINNTTSVYKYRWVILLVFCLYAAVNFLQFLQYTIISNITMKYYNVDSTIADLAGLIFMICFVVFSIPVNYIIEKYNLRVVAILSSGMTTVGNLIKLLSVSRDRFYVVMIGQTLCAIAQVFMLSIPSKLASTWFGPEEVSIACGIAILGTQIGVALGSVFGSNVVKNSDNMDDIGHDFLVMVIINASITVAVFILVLIFFRAKPALPPSQSQINIVEVQKPSILQHLKAMAKSKDYILLGVAFGGTNGLYTCFGIILNTVYLKYFPGFEQEVGIISAIAVVAGGCLGSVVFGYALDRWHHFKLTSFSVIFLSAITYIFVALSLELQSQLATYFTIPIFGFFIASTLLVGFEFATEVMYPVPEAASCSILNSVIYIFTIIYTLIFEALMESVDYKVVHGIIIVVLILYSIVIYFVNPNLRRREANVTN